MKTLIALFVSAAAALLVTPGKALSDTEQHLKVVLSTSPSTIDPQLALTSQDMWVSSAAFIPPILITKNQQPIPYLISDFEVSADKTVYDLHLAEDRLWSDSQPITADDIAFTIQRRAQLIVDGKIKPRAIFSGIKNFHAVTAGEMDATALGIEVVDRHHIRIYLEEPDPAFLHRMADFNFGIIPKHAVMKYGDRWTDFNNLVVSGPFAPSGGDFSEMLRFKRNDHFAYSGHMHLDSMEFHFAGQNRSSMRIAQEIGAHIVLRLPGEAAQMVRQFIGEDTIRYFGGLNVERINFNLASEKMQDKNVRRAISLAIDVEGTINKALLAAVPAYYLLPETFLGPRDVSVPRAPLWQRKATAKKLLGTAGYSEDNPLVLNFGSYEVRNKRQYVRHIVSDLEDIGIRVIPRFHDKYASLNEDFQSGTIDLTLTAWGGPLYDPGYFLVPLQESGYSLLNCDNPEVEARMQSVSDILDYEEKITETMAVMQHFLDESLVFPVLSLGALEVVMPQVTYTQFMDANEVDSGELWTIRLD